MLPTIHIYSSKHFERWDYNTPCTTGIGGSETSHIEMAMRLAALGYKVKSYCPLSTERRHYSGVEWCDVDDADFHEDGLWILYRCPQEAEKLDGQQCWVICQDVDYPPEWTNKALDSIKYIFALCDEHAFYLQKTHPQLTDKIRITSNGIDSNFIDSVFPNMDIERNPHRIMYASSPDRGLLRVIDIFKRALEFIPTLELHCYYGFQNLIKASEKFTHNNWLIEKIEKAASHPRIFMHGRVNNFELYCAWHESNVWLYPTHFYETNCITSMEAQALGAIPICSPLWAVKEKVKYGIFVDGQPDDRLVQARFLGELLRLLSNREMQESIRKPMMEYARRAYDWHNVVTEWDKLIRKDYAVC